MDEMGSEESFQEVPVIQVPMTSEERLLRRLGEVDRCVSLGTPVDLTVKAKIRKFCLQLDAATAALPSLVGALLTTEMKERKAA